MVDGLLLAGERPDLVYVFWEWRVDLAGMAINNTGRDVTGELYCGIAFQADQQQEKFKACRVQLNKEPNMKMFRVDDLSSIWAQYEAGEGAEKSDAVML